MLKKWSLCVLC